MNGKTGLMPSISLKYPTNRDVPLKNGYAWLDGRRQDEGAEGLWRIYDNLYDFTDFIKQHPGGQDWLRWTHGCDITELFEIHHLTKNPEIIMAKYFVRKAETPRNFKFTMNEDGFYKVLKRKVIAQLPNLDRGKRNNSKLIIDALLVTTVVLAILSARVNSYLLATVSGLFLTWTIIGAHNFFHQKDNLRMKYWNISLMSYRNARISHVLSHHVYPNTLHDLEISFFEDFLKWIPSEKLKGSGVRKYISWIMSPILYGFLYILDFVKHVITCIKMKGAVLYWDEIWIPLVLPTAMMLLGSNDLWQILKLWFVIIWSGSFAYGWIAINGAHHHPDIQHEGDSYHPSLDWGVFTMDTVMEREDFQGNIFWCLTHFGDHILHHLFPILDQSLLPALRETLLDTCKEFETDFREVQWWELIVGQFQQLVRTEVNPVPVGLRGKGE